MISFLFVTELRKESRRLEVEIDLKLISFGKLGSSYAQRESKCVPIYNLFINRVYPFLCNQVFCMLYTCSPDSPGVGGSGHVFDTMALEIEQLLSKVNFVSCQAQCSPLLHQPFDNR